MYLMLSQSKLNLFVNLLALVLLSTDEDASTLQMSVQGLILGLSVTHFILLVASHMSYTRCATSLAWRLFLILVILFMMTALTYAIYLDVLPKNGNHPTWYLILSACLTVPFLFYEIRRTKLFMTAARSAA